MAGIRSRQLERDPHLAAGAFDLAHLQTIHHHLLQDVYGWAGQLRTPGQHTEAMGITHCPPEQLAAVLDDVFADIRDRRPSPTDTDHALNLTADHWSALTWAHPMLDGNSRSQRVFFTQYLHDSDWDIDWRAVDADAVHAARHVSFVTEDPTWLAEQLRPGLIRPGDHVTTSLSATDGIRDELRPVAIYYAMMQDAENGVTGEQFHHHQHTLEHRTRIDDLTRELKPATAADRASPPDHSDHLEHLAELERQRQAQHHARAQSTPRHETEPSHVSRDPHRRL
nr:Fic family protein [Gordonia sp. SID5947]